MVRGIQDPQEASKALVNHALARFSTDNLSCMVVRFDNKALKARKTEAAMGVDGDQAGAMGGISEADAIVSQARKNMGGEPDQPVEAAAAVIMEEEENENHAEPGPELNEDALKAAQVSQKST